MRRAIREAIPVAILLGLIAGGCRPDKDEAVEAVRKVGVVRLAKAAWTDSLEVPATVSATATVNVVARVPGRLKEIRVEEGTEVAAGAVLAVLDTRDMAIALHAAEGQAEMARAGLAAATVQRDNLAADLGRFAELRKTGTVSLSEAEKLEAAFKAAEAQVGVAAAQVRVATAGLEAARKNFADTTVIAPVSGVVVRRLFDVGQETSPAAGPLFVLASVDPLRVEGVAPEAALARVREGQEARVRLDALPEQTFSGTVELVGPVVDPLGKTVRLRVSLPNPVKDGRRWLVPGMSAVISLVQDQGRFFVLPLNAVRRLEGDDVVLMLAGPDSKLVERRVRPVRKEGLRFLVSEGLSEGERLVVVAPPDLLPGASVVPVVLSGSDAASPGGAP